MPSFLFLALAILKQSIPVQSCILDGDSSSVRDIGLKKKDGPGFIQVKYILPELDIKNLCGYEYTEERLGRYDQSECICQSRSLEAGGENAYLIAFNYDNNNDPAAIDCMFQSLADNCPKVKVNYQLFPLKEN